MVNDGGGKMKVRTGFVSNSSSSSFMIAIVSFSGSFFFPDFLKIKKAIKIKLIITKIIMSNINLFMFIK